jgi:hypothetical protein
MSEKITEQDFFKSLERLEALAKGSGTENDLQKSQICTGSGNEPQSWPGGDKTEYGEGWDDNIAEDGTDYKRKSGRARKSIAEKVMKGAALTPEEVSLIKGDFDAQFAGKDDKDEDDKDKDKDKAPPPPPAKGEDEDLAMGKSFGDSVQENETLQKGIEVSDFLNEFAKSFAAGLGTLEQRVTANVLQALGAQQEGQAEFNKSLADAVVNIGHGLAGFMQQQEAVADAPAGPPRSQLRAVAGGQANVQVLNKSQGGNSMENLSKAQILDRMGDMVEKGQCSPLDVIKYEATGDLNPQLQDSIVKSLAASGQ